MTHSTDDQFNVQWDVLQGPDTATALLDPLSDLNNNNNNSEPAVLNPQSVNYLYINPEG
jgi:hypothetical protein